MATTKTIDFTVTGEQTIHCSGCEQRIHNALRRLPGIRDAQASATNQRVRVTLDPAQVDPQEVQQKLAQLGYHAEEVAR